MRFFSGFILVEWEANSFFILVFIFPFVCLALLNVITIRKSDYVIIDSTGVTLKILGDVSHIKYGDISHLLNVKHGGYLVIETKNKEIYRIRLIDFQNLNYTCFTETAEKLSANKFEW